MRKANPAGGFTWTPELAYAIGLLVTDGNLSKDGRHIAFRSSDIQLIKTYKKCLSLKNQIGHTTKNGFSKTKCYRIQHGDVRLHRWLQRIGITPAKTYTIGGIKIPRKFFRDFLRGHLDGDGYIQRYIDTYNIYKNRTYTAARLYLRFISASQAHAQWLFGMIKKLVSVKGTILFKKPFTENRVPMWEVRFSKYDSLKLLRLMYYQENLPALERKKIIAEKALKELIA